jgi:1,2-diacylglycerol 3-alpha-glucosyltransferase
MMEPNATAPRALTIGMFTDTYIPETNGVVTSLVSTAKALRRLGHRVVIVGPAHPQGDDEHPDVFHLRSMAFPFYPGFRLAFPLPAKLVAGLPSVPFDVIHAHTFFFIGCLGAYLAHMRRLPLFFTYHTRFEDYTHYLPVHHRVTRAQAVWLSREFSNRCDRIIAPTSGTVDLLRSYGVTTPFSILPGGVDLESFGPSDTAPAAITAARPGPVLLSVGRLGKEKNLDFLIESFAGFSKLRDTARLVLCGDGPHRGELEERARALGVSDKITFVGALEQRELGAFYRHADVFAFTSLTETQGLVIVEAMSHGLPVVAVDCPVTKEIVSEAAGILTPPNVSDFAQGLDQFLAEPAEQRAARHEAARRVAAPFGMDAVAKRLEDLYLQTLRDAVAAGS